MTALAGLWSQQTRLMPGQEEITGPSGDTTHENFCEPLRGMEMLGKEPGAPNGATAWYMVEAVEAHEHVHEEHLLPAVAARWT